MPVLPPTANPIAPVFSAGDIIARSLRATGALAAGETPDGMEADECLAILNGMMDAWNAERLMIFTIQRLLFVPATLKQTYTLGTLADFDSPRPAKIEGYGVVSLNNPAQPLELPLTPLTDALWQAVPVKNIQSSLPTQVWDDEGFPFRNLSYWPIPNVQVNFTIYPWTALTSFVDASTDYAFPPGYYECIVYNLAARMAAEGYGQATQLLLLGAQKALERVKTINVPLIDLKCDPAVVGSGGKRVYNWLSDGPIQKLP